MKNLTCLLPFSAVIGLGALGAAAALGIPLAFDRIAPAVVGLSGGAGVLGFLMMDYAPGRTRPTVAARVAQPKREAAPALPRRVPVPLEVPFDATITVNLIRTLNVRAGPATVSLS